MTSKVIKDKVIVITGGATGIGFDIADKFLKKEARNVILLDIDEEEGAKALNTLATKHGDGKVDFIKGDVTSDLDIAEKIIHKYKNVDVLVNSAGVSVDVRKTIAINITALIEWSLKFEEHMKNDNDGKGGTIINLSSIYGYRPFFMGPVYCASKFAVTGFTRSLGDEHNFRKSNVRVVAICPGYTESNFTVPINMKIKSGMLDEYSTKYLQSMAWQTVGVVGDAAVEVFQIASSGSCWLIEGGRPIEEISFDN